MQDKILKRAIEIFRLTAGEQKKVVKLLKKMARDLFGKISSDLLDAKQKRIANTLLREVEETINDYYKLISEQQQETVKELSAHVVDTTIKDGSLTVLPTAAALNEITKDAVIIGAPLSKWWEKQSVNTAFKLKAALRIAISESETVDEALLRVRPILKTEERNARAIVHTTMQHVSNKSRLAVFRANGDVIRGIKQLTTFDSHTSDICIAYSGASWDLDLNPIDGNKLPYNGGVPRHVNCRSVENAILKQPTGIRTTRASDEGQIKFDTTMEQFLKGKDKEYVDDLLGPGRAELWRDGKITLKDLVDQHQRPLTIKELKALK